MIAGARLIIEYEWSQIYVPFIKLKERWRRSLGFFGCAVVRGTMETLKTEQKRLSFLRPKSIFSNR